MSILSTNTPPSPEPGREHQSEVSRQDLPSGGLHAPLAVFNAPIVLPEAVHDRATFGDWLGTTVGPLKREVIAAFEAGIKGVAGLNEEQRERLVGNVYLAVDELLVNVACYGLGGITSEQRVAAYLDGSEEPELEEAIRARLADPEVRERKGSITLAVFEDRVELAVFDGTPFVEFKERWERAQEAILEENLFRKSGRGLFLIQSYGFTAEQSPSGTVTYTLRW